MPHSVHVTLDRMHLLLESLLYLYHTISLFGRVVACCCYCQPILLHQKGNGLDQAAIDVNHQLRPPTTCMHHAFVGHHHRHPPSRHTREGYASYGKVMQGSPYSAYE